jgi:hypothetical protein
VIWKYFVVGQVMGDYDTDVAEFLYKPGAQRAGLSKLLCKDLSKACVGKVPPVPKVILATCELPYLSALLSVQCIFISQCTSHLSKFMLYLQLVPMLGLLGAIKFLYLDFTMNLVSVLLVQDREPGEAFTPKPTKDAEMERLMRSMSDMPGAGGMKMYSREDLTNNPDLVGGGPEVSDDDEEEDDDSDDDVDFQNLLRESKSTTAVGKSPQDSKVQKVLDVVSQIGIETGRLLQSAKQQVDRTAAQLSDWWYGKKPSSKSSTASKSKTKSRSGSSSYEL